MAAGCCLMGWKPHLICAVACLLIARNAAPAVEPVAADEATLKAAGVASDGAALLDFFRKHTRRGAGRAQVQTLISQLGDDSFERREQASLQLVEIGELALDQLRQAQRDKDPGVANRARECLEKIQAGKGSTSRLISAAARLTR